MQFFSFSCVLYLNLLLYFVCTQHTHNDYLKKKTETPYLLYFSLWKWFRMWRMCFRFRCFWLRDGCVLLLCNVGDPPFFVRCILMKFLEDVVNAIWMAAILGTACYCTFRERMPFVPLARPFCLAWPFAMPFVTWPFEYESIFFEATLWSSSESTGCEERKSINFFDSET